MSEMSYLREGWFFRQTRGNYCGNLGTSRKASGISVHIQLGSIHTRPYLATSIDRYVNHKLSRVQTDDIAQGQPWNCLRLQTSLSPLPLMLAILNFVHVYHTMRFKGSNRKVCKMMTSHFSALLYGVTFEQRTLCHARRTFLSVFSL